MIRPILAEKDISKEHLDVLRVMLSVIENVLIGINPAPEDLEQELYATFQTGSLKLSDPKRWISMDDISKAVKCFAVVVQVC
jgi:hypothetical protein